MRINKKQNSNCLIIYTKGIRQVLISKFNGKLFRLLLEPGIYESLSYTLINGHNWHSQSFNKKIWRFIGNI